MAKTGLRHMVAAPIPEAPEYGALPTYGKGFIVGRAIEADPSISMNDNNLYADNRVVNVDKSFSAGSITIGVDEFGEGTELSQAQVEELLTGSKIVEENGERYLDFGETPKLNTVGLGWIEPGRYPDSEKKYFEAVWYWQVTFGGIRDERASTKGENITWTTPTIEGVMKPVAGYDAERNLRRKARFDTEGEAIVWLNTMAGIDLTADQLATANNDELYVLYKKYGITTPAIESAAGITAENREAVISAIVAAQNATVDNNTDDDTTDGNKVIGG